MPHSVNHNSGFATTELLIIIAFVLVIGVAGWFFFHKVGDHPGAPRLSAKILVEISNGGSTNNTGWDLKIGVDGSGVLHCDPGPQLNKSCDSRTYKRNTFAASTLSNDLTKTNLKNYRPDCAYSASFGSVDTLTYKGTSTDGIDCYVQNEHTPLAADLQAVLAKVDLQP